MKKLRIGYFADGPWSYRAFDLLVNDASVEIAFIVPRTDSTDMVLFELAQKHGIPFHKGFKINSPEFYELAGSYQCDLFVSMSFNQIFKPKITDQPRLGTINCHAGKLPFYRGRNILNWALINDEKEFGITVHFVDEGIDTGDIILQKTYPVTDADDYASLLSVSHEECAVVLYEAVKQMQAGHYKRVAQKDIHAVGFYCGQRGTGDETINWKQASRQLFNFIRAICSPGPMAQTTCGGKLVKINAAKMIEGAPSYICIPGQLVGKTADGFIVKTADSSIEITGIVSEHKLKVGDRLGT
jgi:methionyl-tRNA formyltransferase